MEANPEYDGTCAVGSRPSSYVEPKWDCVVTIKSRSSRGDKWVAHLDSGKVVLVDQTKYFHLAAGVRAPIKVHTEKKKVAFAFVERSVVIDGVYAPMPEDYDFESAAELERFVEETRTQRKLEAAIGEQRRLEYARRRGEQRAVIETLIHLDSLEDSGRYMQKAFRRVDRLLSDEERKLLCSYFGLPPWGVTERDGVVTLDSYTD
jgi:hypothetical protein